MNALTDKRSDPVDEELKLAPKEDLAAIDRARRVAELLLAGGENHQIAAALNYEVKGLHLAWEPAAQLLPAEELRTVFEYWRSLPQQDGLPNVLKVDPQALRPALGYIMLVDADDDREHGFRYALYGSKISAVSGFDLTGKSIWDIPTISAIQVFFAGCYLAVRRRKRPLYSVHEAPPSITVSHWHRLILPLAKDGEVQRFLVCNVPIKEDWQR